MDVLIIGLDDSLLKEGAASDTRERHIDYANELTRRVPSSTIHIIVLSKGWGQTTREQLSSNLIAYPSNSVMRYSFPYDAYRIGSRICSANEIDLITTQTPFDDGIVGSLLSQRHEAAYLVQLRPLNLDDPYWLGNRRLNHLLRYVGKRVLKSADAVRVESEPGRRWCQESLGIPYDDIFVNPMAMSHLKRDRLNVSVETDPSNITFVGRFTEVKGLSYLIKAFAELLETRSDIELTLVGDGPQRDRLEAMVREFEIEDSVHFVGAVPYEEVSRYYARAALLVLPSHRETFGRVILEAFAHETPVVATTTRGASELIEDGMTGLLVSKRDSDELAQKIGRLLDDGASREQMGQNARKFVEDHFDPDQLVEQLVDTWIMVAESS